MTMLNFSRQATLGYFLQTKKNDTIENLVLAKDYYQTISCRRHHSFQGLESTIVHPVGFL